MNSHLRQTTIVTLACLALLGGLVMGRHLAVSGWSAVAALIGSVSLWRTRFRSLLMIMLFFMLGLWRAGQVNAHDQVLNNLTGQKVTLVGTVKDDPSLNDQNQLSFTIGVTTLSGHPYQADVSVYTYRITMQRGYRIMASGKLKPALGAAQAEVSFPTIQTLSTHLNWLEQLRLKYFAAERTAIPEPMASFALGLLIGARALIPKTLQAQ